MLTIKQIKENITLGNSLKFLSQSYNEVAASKLKRIRRGIERNRDFLNEIAGIYALVKLVATQRRFTKIPSASPFLNRATSFVIKGFTNSRPKGVSKRNQTSIAILLTSNYRFYGTLERKLIETFLQASTRFTSRAIVVGRIGIEFLKAVRFSAFEPVVFKSDLPQSAELRALIGKVQTYDRILVYHSTFQSVLSQAPAIKDIKEAQFEVSIPRKRIDYIFEPEIDKMLTFFDTQISSILLEQTFLESELARTAARLVAMNNAEDNASEFLEKENLALGLAQRSVFNASLLDMIAGTMLRRKKGHADNQ